LAVSAGARTCGGYWFDLRICDFAQPARQNPVVFRGAVRIAHVSTGVLIGTGTVLYPRVPSRTVPARASAALLAIGVIVLSLPARRGAVAVWRGASVEDVAVDLITARLSNPFDPAA